MRVNEQPNANKNKQNQPKEVAIFFQKKKRDFQYSVFTIGTTTKIIRGFATSDDHSHGELSFFKEVVLETIDNCPKFDTLYGDGIYANRVVCGLLEQTSITSYLLPMSTVTFRSRGVPFWKSMLYSLAENSQQWLECYHNRSISESVNSMLKKGVCQDRKKSSKSLKTKK